MRMLWWVIVCLLAMAPAVGGWALQAPAPASPADMDDGVAPTLTLHWDAVPGATRYRVEVRSAHSRSEFITKGTDCPLSDLPIATEFHWRVRAENTRGSSSWSARFLFTTLAPALPGQLVLCVARAETSSLYQLNADGSNLCRLSPHISHAPALDTATDSPLADAMDFSPVYSPNGQKIAFCSTRDGRGALYLMNSDGSSLTRLTANAETACVQPHFTTDGASLLFCYGNTMKQLARLDLAGGEPVGLTEQALGDIRHFACSPDGHHVACIAVSTADAAHGVLYLVDLQGGAAHKLADNADPDSCPAFSADGMVIAYSSAAGEMLPTEPRRAGDGSLPALLPLLHAHTLAFTLDGTRLYGIRTESKETNLFGTPVEGEFQVIIAGNVRLPLVFSPDGRYFAYAVTRADHSSDLYIREVEGRQCYRLTDQHWQLTSFDWGCAGKAPAPADPTVYQDIPVREFS